MSSLKTGMNERLRAAWRRNRALLQRSVLASAMALASLAAGAEEALPSLRVSQPWSCVFADHDLAFSVTVTAARPLSGRMGWSLAVAGRTVFRREQAVTSTPDKPAEVDLRTQLPPVKPGVVVAASLSVVLMEDGVSEPVAQLTRPLWIFPEDASHARHERLRELKLQVFDPERKLVPILEEAEVPFETIQSSGALEGVQAGTIVIGPGVAPEDNRGLWSVLAGLAAAGRPVLWLCPGEGRLNVPGAANSQLPAPMGLHLQRTDIITQLDKRLDASGWPPDGKLVGVSFELSGTGETTVLQVCPGDTAWPWFCAEFATGGRLVLCGFDLVDGWAAGPVPRFLFARMIEWLHESQKKEERQ
ncbi:MAG: hypothetical protein A3K19_12725 [Lentisphaerae bacterium RIFOXYB12_FULL_65_16]|nr:MAG: hypothetical protein A3K18_24325 [Lentisphaerae bacterium RIFOXYA12_64_32]OGV88088.1 MAG: hypothetical protein A3K19_12725 [Lentisphaerae bacterium RIFOXYB12_FULL_65_16]